jgi:uncharacterized protein YbgA (DUF1722 family)/uncharacterized protein YbbK (DUF523 family)
VRLGVSACLLGQRVRFDGGHKRDPFLTDLLGRFVEWIPVCPEEEAGLGTPREAMRLVRTREDIRLLTVRSRRDLTAQLSAYSTERAVALASLKLDGYVLKKDSPSCGLTRVKVYAEGGMAERSGRGIFANALCAALPLLPLEEEGRLCDPRLRENFIVRAFAHRRLQALLKNRPRIGDLMRFHARHKLLLLAHSPKAYAQLGRSIAAARGPEASRLAARYGAAFMAALAIVPTRGRHSNVLQHMVGYFRDLIDPQSRQDLSTVIADYGSGHVPLVVPVTLLTYFARRHGVQYLIDQVYLQPHPKELMLRNHA